MTTSKSFRHVSLTTKLRKAAKVLYSNAADHEATDSENTELQPDVNIRDVLQVEVYTEAFTAHNALQLVAKYDVVLDCTDNAPSRYLISDTCVVASKPLVSGAAIGTEGQLTVYHHGEDGMLLT